MSLKEQLDFLESEKQRIKLESFCSIPPHSFEKVGMVVEIKSVWQRDGALCIVSVVDGMEDEHLFINPPILVPDQDGNLYEDLTEALHVIVYETLKLTR